MTRPEDLLYGVDELPPWPRLVFLGTQHAMLMSIFSGPDRHRLPARGRQSCVDALLRSPSGKILKRELRERYWQGQERQVH